MSKSTLLSLWLIIPLLIGIGGCKTFYQESGVSITTGDVTAPVEISDSSDIITIRVLFSMDGMRLWTARGYNVQMDYEHGYTNSYFFGLVDKIGSQRAKGNISVATNDFSSISSPTNNMIEGCKSK